MKISVSSGLKAKASVDDGNNIIIFVREAEQGLPGGQMDLQWLVCAIVLGKGIFMTASMFFSSWSAASKILGATCRFVKN